jgi:uncharacterized membrane protein YhaH (DUF805 family)
MIKCIKHRLIHIFSFSENAGRLDFFLTLVGLIFVGNSPFILHLSLTDERYIHIVEKLINLFFKSAYLFGAYIILVLILHFANICRRLNDMGKNNGYTLIIFIPLFNLIFLLILLLTPGEKKNQ